MAPHHVVLASLLAFAPPGRPITDAPRARLARPAAVRTSVRAATDAAEGSEPPAMSILDLEQFSKVKRAADVVAVAAQRAKGRGKEANDVLIRELISSSDINAAIQLHYDWVSSIKFLRGLQVRIEKATADKRKRAQLEQLMAQVRAEIQARMDTASRLISASLPMLASTPLAMRVLARRGLLDEALVLMLVANAERAATLAKERERGAGAGGAADDGSAARLCTLLQRLAQDAMRELDLPVAAELIILRRLLQTRAPSARRELASRAAAGDRLVTDQPVDVEKMLEVVREFRAMEENESEPDREAAQKLGVIERELAALLRDGTNGAAM